MDRPTRALSVRQPYAELIISGKKRVEYRSIPTNIRERVFVYASKTPADQRVWKRSGLPEGSLPTGVVIGTVEIAGCSRRTTGYAWTLKKPERAKRLRTPANHPQPVWFSPFA